MQGDRKIDRNIQIDAQGSNGAITGSSQKYPQGILKRQETPMLRSGEWLEAMISPKS
jgi:hypothetical protein